MARYHITQAEAYVLSFLPSGQFHAEDRQLYHDHVSPKLIRDLLTTYDYEDAIAILTYVIQRIDIRYDRAKDQYGRGLKIELDALEQYPRYWRDFNRQIDQARLGWQSPETFFENFIDEDFARGVSERPIQNPSDALSRAMKTYLTNRMVEGS